MTRKTLGLLCCIGFVTLVPGIVQAQTSAGALQLGLGTDVVTYDSMSVTRRNYPLGGGLGLGDYTEDVGTTRWGFSDRSSVLIEGGYGLGDSLVLGGFLGLGGWSRKSEPPNGNTIWEKQSVLDFFIAPKLDYMLFPGQSIRPFFGGAIGLLYHSEEYTERTNTVTRTMSDSSATGLALMARGGVRFFLTPGFSIDPALMFMWIPTASGSYTNALGAKYDLGAHGYTVGLTVAASGWLGL